MTLLVYLGCICRPEHWLLLESPSPLPSYPASWPPLFQGSEPFLECQPTKMRSPYLSGSWILCCAQTWSIPGSLLGLTMNEGASPNLDPLHLTFHVPHVWSHWSWYRCCVFGCLPTTSEPAITFKHRVSTSGPHCWHWLSLHDFRGQPGDQPWLPLFPTNYLFQACLIHTPIFSDMCVQDLIQPGQQLFSVDPRHRHSCTSYVPWMNT